MKVYVITTQTEDEAYNDVYTVGIYKDFNKALEKMQDVKDDYIQGLKEECEDDEIDFNEQYTIEEEVYEDRKEAYFKIYDENFYVAYCDVHAEDLVE